MCIAWGFWNYPKVFSHKYFNFVLRNTIFVVQSLNHIWLFATPWNAAGQTSLSFTIYQSLLKLMSIELVMPSSHLILCHPLLFLPLIFLSIRVFSTSHQMAKVLELQHQFFQRIFRVDFLRTDWFDLLAIQGTIKSLLQHHSSKVSILSNFFIVQFSHLYLTTRTPIL